MRLKDWLDAQGRGALSRMSKATRLPYPTLHKIKNGRAALGSTAKVISEYTGGEVSIAELVVAPDDAPNSELGREVAS